MGNGLGRREFLKILGAGGATAALVGCAAEPPEKLIPYLVPPENIIPGVASWYASVCRECPAGCGIVLRTREGRVVKAEGNPFHPVNQGRLCARGQASLQGLYNPDRIRQPLFRGNDGQLHPVSWDEAEERVAERLADLRQAGRAEGVVFITTLLGGALDKLINEWMTAIGSDRHVTYEPFAYEALRASHRIAFGRDAIPAYDLESSQYLLSFGADFLETWLSPVEHARGFGAMRAYRGRQIGSFSYIGPRLSLTAASADEWIKVKPGTEGFLALGMLHVILAEKLTSTLARWERDGLERLTEPYAPARVAELAEIEEETVFRLARAFAQTRPSLALSGGVGAAGSNATSTCVAVNLLNYAVGNVGKTVRFGPNAHMGSPVSHRGLLELVKEMSQGKIPLIFFYGANPIFTLPGPTGFREALRKVPLVVSFSTFLDETTAEADLVLPDHSPLESWGDYSPREGVYGLLQPAMRPLFQTRALGDTLLSIGKKIDGKTAGLLPWPSFYDYLRGSWKNLQQRFEPDTPFDRFWEKVLRQGGVWENRRVESVRLSPEAFRTSFPPPRFEMAGEPSFYLHLYPSLHHFDGRTADRPWLQELPDPMTQIAWDNWLEIHPETALRLGIAEGDVVRLVSPYGVLEISAHLYEWIRPDVVAIPLGQGHTALGRYAAGRGPNPMSLLGPQTEPLSGGAVFLSVKVKVFPTGKRRPLVSVAGSDRQEGRGIAQAVGLSELARASAREEKDEEHKAQMYPPHPHPEHRWGMAIDLNACIGCSACIVACNAENNIPVVGKEKMAQGREMSWIRIERYFEVENEKPDVRFVPMMCQQCHSAPCEPVCPVKATYHNREGLNAQVYNRCIGTRYCSNNCPYKVRRFNWFEYGWPDPLHLQLNPDVSVRSKGVMEKCTFCVQRIREAKELAKDRGSPIQDGEILPACVQTCPTQALVFGDLKDPDSRVSKLAVDPRRYRVLEPLNTQPAITYLKKIKRDSEQVET